MTQLMSTLLCLICISIAVVRQDPMGSQKSSAELMSGLGEHHHPISAASPEAQRFFDQGLNLIFGFNDEEATLSFQRAAELDPDSPMPYWGIALASGPNINWPSDWEREKAAYGAIQKALSLAPTAPQHERKYVEALARRYSINPQADLMRLQLDYAKAMGELVERYPDDLDAATLYAESLMDLRPWRLWGVDGTPAQGTEEIIRVLELVLRRDPNHVGANHYYIHAIEASPHPELGLPSAHRLETLAPGAGHLLHMPAHIYFRTGDYTRAAQSSEAAVRADQAYFRSRGERPMYFLMYYTHHLHFLSVAHAEAGNFTEAKEAADQLAAYADRMPPLETFRPVPSFVLLRLHRWEDILKSPPPGALVPMTKCIWHFARGVAQAATGNVELARFERTLFYSSKEEVPPDFPVGDTGLNSAGTILRIAGAILDARISEAAGDRKTAIESLRTAVELQDTLAYDEPPAWYYPVRESLGAALALAGRPSEAEIVFRADLDRDPRNGRSLFGLWRSLAAQGKAATAERAQRQFELAWQSHAKLRLEDF